TQSRAVVLLALFCDDGTARAPHDCGRWNPDYADLSFLARAILRCLFCAGRDVRTLLAFRGYCVDFLVSVPLFTQPALEDLCQRKVMSFQKAFTSSFLQRC